nr:MAGE-like protein 2 [Penaeus vannamei]
MTQLVDTVLDIPPIPRRIWRVIVCNMNQLMVWFLKEFAVFEVTVNTLTVVLAVGFLVDAEAKPAPSPMVLPYGVPGPVLPGMLGAPVVQPMSPMMYPPTPALLAPHPPMLPIHPPVISSTHVRMLAPMLAPTNAAYVSSSSSNAAYVSSSSTNATYAPAYVSSSSTNASHPIAMLPAPMIPSMLTVVLAVGFLVDAEAKPAPSPMVLPYGVPDTVLPGMLGAPVAQPMSPMMYPPTPALLAPHPPMLPIHPPMLSHPPMLLMLSSSTNAAYVSSNVADPPMLPMLAPHPPMLPTLAPRPPMLPMHLPMLAPHPPMLPIPSPYFLHQ